MYDEQIDISTDPVLALAVTNPQAVELARRRKLAEKLIGSNMQTYRGDAGVIAPYSPGTAIGNIANQLAGKLDMKGVAADERQLAMDQASNTASLLEKAGVPAGQAQMLAASPESLRKTVAALWNAETASSDRQTAIEQRRQQAEDNNQLRRDLANQSNNTRIEIAGMPSRSSGAGGTSKPPKGSAGAGLMWQQDGEGNWEATIIPNGAKDPNGPNYIAPGDPKITQDQANANLFASRMENSNKIFDDVGTNYSPLRMNILDAVPLGAGNFLKDTNEQKVSQAQRDFINATLRRESGAVITDPEFANARIQYLPQPGDKPDVLKQKAANRLTAIAGIRTAAGPAGDRKTTSSSVSDSRADTSQTAQTRTKVNSVEEFNNLPAGAKWETPDGRRGTK